MIRCPTVSSSGRYRRFWRFVSRELLLVLKAPIAFAAGPSGFFFFLAPAAVIDR